MKMKAENEVEPEDEPLSFSAGLGANFTRNAENHGIVVYDQIQLVSRSALPGGYNPETGIFVAPKDGESYVLVFNYVTRYCYVIHFYFGLGLASKRPLK